MGVQKKDEVARNKAILVCKGYSHKEGMDFEETFAPFSRLEVVRIFFAYATNKNFKFYQMDIKSTVLNGELAKDVYIE